METELKANLINILSNALIDMFKTTKNIGPLTLVFILHILCSLATVEGLAISENK
jgi:hypothetical protein